MFIACAAIAEGWGKPMAYVTPHSLVQILKLEFAVQTTWLFTLLFVRLSVACSLLRFGTERWWRAILYFIMTFQCLIWASYVVIQFGQCRPVSANWESVPDVKCWPTQPIIDYGWAIAGEFPILRQRGRPNLLSGVYIAMDLVLSLMPIKLIRSLTRSTAEKILIGFLMSLGLLATAVACAKMTTFPDFGKGDPLQATMKPSTFAKLEEQVGIIACSLPCLKQPAEQLLRKLGLLKEHQLTRPSFVNTVQMQTQNKEVEADQRSGSDGSAPSGKDAVRVDSVAFKPGSANSAKRNQTQMEGPSKEGWQAV